MGTKSLEVIRGGTIMGAKIRTRSAREEAQKATPVPTYAWSVQMERPRGPAQPSPTIAQCLNGGLGWLDGRVHRCETRASLRFAKELLEHAA
jgi:hypothetical protein